MALQNQAAVNVGRNLTINNVGIFDLDGGTLLAPTVTLQAGAQFNMTAGMLHAGTFNGNLVNQGGKLAPGQSAGNTTILGNYTQQAGAGVEAEIGGTSAGGTYDLLSITGSALLGGQLQLKMLNGFNPSASNTFTLLNAAGGIFGVFSNVTTGQRLTTVDGIGSFVVNYGPGSGFNQNQIVLSAFESLIPMLPGDYNQNGVVDSADYVVWRNGLGTTYTQNDYNT